MAAAENLAVLEAEMRRAAAALDAGSTPLMRACLVYVRRAWDHPNHYRLEFGGDHAFTPNPGYGARDLPRILTLALRNLAPR